MAFTIDFFRKPRLNPLARLGFEEDACTIALENQEYELTFEPEVQHECRNLLGLLGQGGRTFAELKVATPQVASRVDEIVRSLDRLGLIVDSTNDPVEVPSGVRFHRELRAFVARIHARLEPSPFVVAMENGTISKRALIGYALEYYHIVRMCPSLLAPSMAHLDTPGTAEILQRFFVSELNHDRYLVKALASIGINKGSLEEVVPLPSTFAVCSSLGVYARLHPMSFKACLDLYEASMPTFNDLFVTSCQRVGLPEGFYKPILDHAQLNDDGGHGAIGDQLFAEVFGVSDEEATTTRRHVAVLVETMHHMGEEILTYYGNETNVSPRIYGE